MEVTKSKIKFFSVWLAYILASYVTSFVTSRFIYDSLIYRCSYGQRCTFPYSFLINFMGATFFILNLVFLIKYPQKRPKILKSLIIILLVVLIVSIVKAQFNTA